MPIWVEDHEDRNKITDNFDRADNTTTIGPDWTNRHQNGTMGIVSNRLSPTGTTDGRRVAWNNNRMMSHDHYVQFTVGTQTNARRTGVILRADSTNIQSFMCLGYAGTTAMELQRISAISSMPGWQDTASGVTRLKTFGTVAVGDVIRIEAEMQQFRVYKNGVFVDSYNSQPYTLNINCVMTGVFSVRGSSSSSGALDNFEAGDL